jgi:hypothetical protein
MQLGKWGEHITKDNYQSKMLVFKFGGVVGMDWNGDFTTANIKFNPTVAVTLTDDYSTVPSYSTADWNANRKDVSASTYHNLANIKAGKGDPCKLIGLTVAQIKAGQIDSKAWRLPTMEDNQKFVGSEIAQPDGEGNYIWTPNGENATNPPVGTVLNGTANGAVLPVVGWRSPDPSGAVSAQGIHGHFWSSTPMDDSNGHRLYWWAGYINPSYGSVYTHGYPVRCVPQS